MSIRPQRRNANRHTQRGMQALEQSISTDGWIGAITVANNGETFDGSARVEKTAENGMLDEAIIVETDGTRPIVVKRTDIPSATDPRAVRLGLAANRVASLNLEWEPDILADILAQGVDLPPSLFTAEELRELAQPPPPTPGGGGDEFDATPQDGPTRTQLGQLWQIGGVHRLLVGDCTDPANVARLMGGERAALCLTDPPYSVGVDYGNDSDTRPLDEFIPWLKNALILWGDTLCVGGGMAFFCGNKHLPSVFGGALPDTLEYLWTLSLYKPYANTRGRGVEWSHWEPVIWMSSGQPVVRPANDFVSYLKFPDTAAGGDHPSPKPTDGIQDFVDRLSCAGDVVVDPFLGSGTTLIAAHRTGRRCYGMEISPRYADVILRRAEAEGLECKLIDG